MARRLLTESAPAPIRRGVGKLRCKTIRSIDMRHHWLDHPLIRRVAAIVTLAVLLFAGLSDTRAAPARADEVAWDALRAGGKVVLIRHALAPGTGDPPGFVLENCATQRNLSAEGRAQAARIGEAFRANGVPVDRVLSSGWCRCIETAALAFGTADVWPPLHSFFQDSSTSRAQTAETRAAVAAWSGPGTLVLVTHQVNITALTDIFPESGELIVLQPAQDRPAGFTITGRIAID
jgi:phosphohistidine phosphatase SixA